MCYCNFQLHRYYINIKDAGTIVYRDGKHSGPTAETSGLLGSPSGGSDWTLEHECASDMCLFSDWAIVLVDCGCPDGQVVSEPCRAEGLHASNAICIPAPSTPAPTPENVLCRSGAILDGEAKGDITSIDCGSSYGQVKSYWQMEDLGGSGDE